MAIHASRSDDGGTETHPVLSRLGAAIRAARRQQGLTQSELADRAGLNRSYVTMLERGRRNASTLTLVQLARALDLPLRDLMPGDEDTRDARSPHDS